jgi:hypothetical protein
MLPVDAPEGMLLSKLKWAFREVTPILRTDVVTGLGLFPVADFDVSGVGSSDSTTRERIYFKCCSHNATEVVMTDAMLTLREHKGPPSASVSF